MRRRSLGKTGLMVSELSFGTVELGLEYGIATPGEQLKPCERHAAAILNEALRLGVNLLDTARAYGDAEEIIGRNLKGRRHEFILVSKIAADPKGARTAVEESLTALQTSHIEVMLIHCGADAMPDRDTAGELLRLREEGAIGFVGASVYGERAALAAVESDWCDCVEIAYSVLDRRPERQVLARAAERQVGILARSVLLKGALTSRISILPAGFDPLKTPVERLLKATDTPIEHLPELAYRYVLMHEPPHSALIGTARISDVRECAGYAEKGALSAELLSRIRSVEPPEQRWLNPGLWPAGAAK